MHLFPNLVDEILDHLRADKKDFGHDFRLWMIGYASSQYTPMSLQYCNNSTLHIFPYYRTEFYFGSLLQVSKLSAKLPPVSGMVCWKSSAWTLS